MEATLLYQTFVFYREFAMVFGKKWVKILIVLSFQLKFDDGTVTLSLIALS